jgi:hypothetical protein
MRVASSPTIGAQETNLRYAAKRNQTMSIPPPTEKTLYSRLGGYDVIAAVVDEFSLKLFRPIRGWCASCRQ